MRKLHAVRPLLPLLLATHKQTMKAYRDQDENTQLGDLGQVAPYLVNLTGGRYE
jgi:hypothetical protein